MLRRLHPSSPFWVSLWLSSLLCLLLLPLLLSQAPGPAGEISLKTASSNSWNLVPGEWEIEEEEDLSPKEGKQRLPAWRACLRHLLGAHLHAVSRPQARYALRPVFLAYHHLRL